MRIHGEFKFHGQACHILVHFHGAADGAVPAFCGGDAQGCFCSHDDGISGSIQVHGPGNAEIEDDTAFQTDEGCCEIIYVESGGILRGIKFGISAQIVGAVAGYGQGLGIAYGVQDHVQGVAADITQRADACCFSSMKVLPGMPCLRPPPVCM